MRLFGHPLGGIPAAQKNARTPGSASAQAFLKEVERSQARLAALFGAELVQCPICSELIFPEETLPCAGRPGCAARLGCK